MVWLGVGDEALEAIGSSCSALENLSLDNLNKCSDRLLQNTAYKYWTADIIGQSVASLNVTSGRSWTYNLWMARSGSARRRVPWTPKYCEHYMPVRSGNT
uniref:Uncharacterized protein n=1 Tax=Oryza meridionalis TaxID=40149 RepID=A0A0E0ELE6_9ORYZ